MCVRRIEQNEEKMIKLTCATWRRVPFKFWGQDKSFLHKVPISCLGMAHGLQEPSTDWLRASDWALTDLERGLRIEA